MDGQVASVVRGKIRHKFEMEAQMGSHVNEGASYHGGVGNAWFDQGWTRLGSSLGKGEVHALKAGRRSSRRCE